MQALDTLIVSIICLILTIANLRKGEDYFSAGEGAYQLEETEVQMELEAPVLEATEGMEGRIGMTASGVRSARRSVNRSIDKVAPIGKATK
jgi:hypothetical protein